MSLPETNTLTDPEEDNRAWYEGLRLPRPLLVVISGPSGVGKDVTIYQLRQRGYPCHFVVTATTRPRRENEVDGVDYHFKTEQEFMDMIERGELLEHAVVYGQYKGIPKAEVRAALDSGLDAILRVDVQGAETIRQLVPQALTIFLSAESDQALIERLCRRRTESEADLQKRVNNVRAELLRAGEFKYRIVNCECRLADTVDQVVAIMKAEKCRTDWQPVSL